MAQAAAEPAAAAPAAEEPAGDAAGLSVEPAPRALAPDNGQREARAAAQQARADAGKPVAKAAAVAAAAAPAAAAAAAPTPAAATAVQGASQRLVNGGMTPEFMERMANKPKKKRPGAGSQ